MRLPTFLFLVMTPAFSCLAEEAPTSPFSTPSASYVHDGNFVSVTTPQGSLLIDVTKGAVVDKSVLTSPTLAIATFENTVTALQKAYPDASVVNREKLFRDPRPDLEQAKQSLPPSKMAQELFNQILLHTLGPERAQRKVYEGEQIPDISLIDTAEARKRQCIETAEADVSEARLKEIILADDDLKGTSPPDYSLVRIALVHNGTPIDQIDEEIKRLRDAALEERKNLDGQLAQAARKRKLIDHHPSKRPLSKEEEMTLIENLAQTSPPLQIVGRPPVQTVPGTIGGAVIGYVGAILVERIKNSEDQGPDRAFRFYLDAYNELVCDNGGCPK